MDFLLLTLQLLFVGYVTARVARRSAERAGKKVGVLTEISAGTRKPALVLHGAGALLPMAATGLAVVEGCVPRTVSTRGVLGALFVVCAGLLMAWAIAELRSWRLLPEVDAGHELCTTRPYGLVRHPMYLAIDLLGIRSAFWVGTVPALVATARLIVGESSGHGSKSRP